MSLRQPNTEGNKKTTGYFSEQSVKNEELFKYQRFYLDFIHGLMASSDSTVRAAGVQLTEMVIDLQRNTHFWFLVRKNILHENADIGAMLNTAPQKEKIAVMLRALKNATHEFKLEKAAREDPLTGSLNRSVFIEDLTECEKQPRGDMVMVAFLDIDQLKRVNDTMGHPMGDELIRLVMKRLNASIKQLGISGARAYRFGGDEVGVLISGANQQVEAYLRALEKILDDVVRDQLQFNGKTWQQTLSVGVVFVKDLDIDSQDKILADADHLMYLAKSTRGEEVRNKPKDGMTEELETASQKTKMMNRDKSKWAIAYQSYPSQTLNDISEKNFLFSRQGELVDNGAGNLTTSA